MNRGLFLGWLLAFWPLSAVAPIEVGEEAIDLSSAPVVEDFGYPDENGYDAIATGDNRAAVAYACQEAARRAGIVYQASVAIVPISGGMSTGVQFYGVGELPVASIQQGVRADEDSR